MNIRVKGDKSQLPSPLVKDAPENVFFELVGGNDLDEHYGTICYRHCGGLLGFSKEANRPSNWFPPLSKCVLNWQIRILGENEVIELRN